MKICLIRLDKIGDLVCSLPVDQISELQGHQVSWVISKGLGFVPRNATPRRRFVELDRSKPWKSYRALRSFLKNENFDMAVSFQAPWWVSRALSKAKIPVRGGVVSQWHSFLYFNRGLRQRRSLAEKHEADYNAELLRYTLQSSSTEATPVLKMQAPALENTTLPSGIAPGQYIVVHPGMAGSALNWPEKNYSALINEFAKEMPVLITGTEMDELYLQEIRKNVQKTANVFFCIGKFGAEQLLAVLDHARVVIAPSTGVAHLAAALGRPVLAFFSPIKVQRPIRWAPRGVKVKILMPPEPKMELITPEEGIAAARSLL